MPIDDTPKGYLTDTGRIVRRVADPEYARRGETVVGEIRFRRSTFTAGGLPRLVVREWIVEAREGSHDRRTFLRSTGSTRADAVAQFLEHLRLWRLVTPARERAAEERRVAG